jgi:hypothetical protein
MDQILEFIKTNTYAVVAVAAAIVVSLVYSVIRMRGLKSTGAAFLQRHPDAARVYLTTKALITAEAVRVHLVGGAAPALFSEKGKTGFYAAPGQVEVSVSYTYTRPGVMYKTVTKSTDVVQKTLEIQPRKSYLLGFDRKAEAFTFEEQQAD